MSRLKEPSTWAGVSGAAAALAGTPLAGTPLAGTPLALLAPVQPWLALLSALAGVAAMYLREQPSGGGSPAAPEPESET